MQQALVNNDMIEFKIGVEDLFADFESHLSLLNNSRILFSGKFGIGKSYFLNEFFKAHNEKYEVFHLFPVNYQISSNENIVEFLRADLFIDLFNKNKSLFEENNFNTLTDQINLLYLWAKLNLKSGLDFVSTCTDELSLFHPVLKLGRPLRDTVGFLENFLKFKEKVKSGDEGRFEDILKDFKSRNLLESDPLSEFLRLKISEQSKATKKESVLILDDLDRIDPDHIFRILNVFSAHFDINNRELFNKFGFDKIILVADAQNLKSIFHHKYGTNTDFNGYFNKFFSAEVFHFRNEEILSKFIEEIISKFKVEDIEAFGVAISSKSGLVKLFLELIFQKSLKLPGKEKLSLKQLMRGMRFSLPAFQKGKLSGLSIRQEKAIPICIKISIEALITIFGGFESDVLATLREIKRYNRDKEDDKEQYVCNLFSKHLLLELAPFDLKTTNLQHGWESYLITINEGEITDVSNKRGGCQFSDLFFDLLIAYIEKGSHKLIMPKF